MNKSKLFSLVGLLVLLSGCATVFNGTKQSVTFQSSPSGADVIIDGIRMGKTPLTVKLKKNKYETVMFEKEGYTPFIANIEKSYDGVALLNVFWDLSTTDAITGAIYEYEPNRYFASLEPVEPVSSSTSKSSEIQRFILSFGDEIRVQLAGREGEALYTLTQLLEIPDYQKGRSIKALRKLALSTKNDLDFSNLVVETFVE